MNFIVRFLGVEVFAFSTDPTPDEDTARDLSGGTLGGTTIEAGTTDLYLGFANGRGDE